MRKNNGLWGILLILIGVLAILNQVFNFNLFSWDTFWPIFVLGPGLMFEFSYFLTRKNPGILVPGGILTVIGLLFFFETFTTWSFSEYTWPVYTLAVAFGLFQLYFFYERKKGHSGLLIPVFILTTISLVSFACMFLGNFLYWLNSSLVVPVVLILFGIFILINNLRGRKE